MPSAAMTSQLIGPATYQLPQTRVRHRVTSQFSSSWARALVSVSVLFWLSGCDQLGLDTPAKTAERKQAEAKAVGSACRHAMRAIEDCYVLNPKADKSSVFAGWREMDEYMRENKLEGVAPVVPRPSPAASKPAASDQVDEAEVDGEGEAEAKGGKPASH